MRGVDIRWLVRVWAFGGALLFGAAGWLLAGPVWAGVGVLAGPCVSLLLLALVLTFTRPDPEDLVRAGRAEEALLRLDASMPGWRSLATRWPNQFRDVLAWYLLVRSEALTETQRYPQALDAADEAVLNYQELAADRPGKFSSGLARALSQQAALLGELSRHGEALGAAEVAVRLYRNLAIERRSQYLPLLADALTRQADELGFLDRLDEARAVAAEAKLIRTDMLPGVAHP